jgi:transaldolase / glucose-6-phosphate isomerase
VSESTSGQIRTRLREVQAVGQSVWYDNIRRGLLDSGEFAELIAAGVTGVTSNPTIFEKAIAGSPDYDRALSELPEMAPAAQFEALAIADIQRAADFLRPTYDATGGRDGFVSLEVSPELADDAPGTVAEARRLWRAVDRPNLMVKVPATAAGLPAIAELIGDGINVNVTLIFALAAYEQVVDAYLVGLERLAAAGKPLDRVASVASFFVSRVDTAVDGLLSAKAQATSDPNEARRLRELRGQAGIANAVRAYDRFKTAFGETRFATLAARGARVQRPLWASTSTKDPTLPDTYYVAALVGPDTVNTVPPAALAAFRDSGEIASRLADTTWAEGVWRDLAAAGIDLDAVTDRLLAEGVASFQTSFQTLLAGVKAKRQALRGG